MIGDITLQELLDKFQKEHELEITMMSSGVTMLYNFFMPAKRLAERKGMKISQLVETVSKNPIPAHVRALVVEVCVNDKTGEDVCCLFLLFCWFIDLVGGSTVYPSRDQTLETSLLSLVEKYIDRYESLIYAWTN